MGVFVGVWFWEGFGVFEIMLLASSHLRWCFYTWSPVARLNSSSFHWLALNKLMLQQKWWLGDYPYLLVLSLSGDGTFPVASCSNFWAVKLCSDQGCNFCHAFVWLQIAGDVIVFCLAMGQCHYIWWLVQEWASIKTSYIRWSPDIYFIPSMIIYVHM